LPVIGWGFSSVVTPISAGEVALGRRTYFCRPDLKVADEEYDVTH
jgi:hypothetical protein